MLGLRRTHAKSERIGCGGRTLLLALALALTVAPLRSEERSNVSVYAGALSVDEGLDDRQFAGAFVNIYDGDVGLHGDFLYVDREEDAGYGAFGISFRPFDGLRPKFTIGTSTGNNNTLPEFAASLSVQIKPEEGSGWTITPTLLYREYRSGTSEMRPSLEVVKYLSLSLDTGGYYVAQARLSTSLSNSDTQRYAIAGGLQTVRSNGMTYGLIVEGGWLDRDPLVGGGATSRYYALRPSVAFRFLQGRELFLRGEYADTDAYTVVGATIGVRIEF